MHRANESFRYDLLLIVLAVGEVMAMVAATIYPCRVQRMFFVTGLPDLELLGSMLLSATALVIGVVYLASGAQDEYACEIPLLVALMTHLAICVSGILLILRLSC